MTTVQQVTPPSATSRLTSLQIGMTAARIGRGGLDRYFFSLTRALPEQGVDVRGLVVGDAGDLDPGDTTMCFAPEHTGLLNRWKALRGRIDAGLSDADLVVSHFAPYAFPVLDKIRHKPLLVHFHGPWALEGAAEGAGKASIAAKQILERIVYSRAARFIVLSRAFATILERSYGVANERIRIVPGGVDLERFVATQTRAEAKMALGWPTDRPIVLSVRRLVHAKGLENLIDAVAAVRRDIPDVLVMIAGTGPLAGELQRRLSELQLDNWVRFAGFVPEAQLPTLYRAADLFVVPTIALEGFGLVVVEALACGTPVIVTPIAGLPEVITDLDPALVLPGAGPQDLARGISDALSGRLPLPSDAQCITYAQRFSWSTIARNVSAVYREIA